MSAWDNILKKYKQQTEERKADWDRRPDELTPKELLAKGREHGLTKYALYEQLNKDLAAGILVKRKAPDGKVYYRCPVEQSTPKPQSPPRSRSSRS